MHAAFEGALPEGWQGGGPVTKHWNGDFIHLYRVTRPCATCGAEIRLDVTRKALQGFSKNAGLLLRNCPTCRAARKAGGPGSRGGTSRPVADAVMGAKSTTVETNAPAIAPAIVKNGLDDDLATVTKERDEAWEMNVELMTELGKLKAQLAKYELQPAMQSISEKMPWET